MTTSTAARTIVSSAGVSFTASLGAFVMDALTEIATWLLVMATVIIVDLLMSIYKIVKVRERKQAAGIQLTKDDCVRLSKGLRDTMAKSATYFAIVVASVFVNNAAGFEKLHIYTCLVVIFGESLSIVGNWCKSHGYDFQDVKLLNWAFSKATLPEDVITKAKVEKSKSKKQ